MKIPYWLYFLSPIFLLSFWGCSEQVEVQKKVEVRPVKTIVVSAPDTGGIRHFPGRVEANKKAELAFRVAGKLEKLTVKEGDLVKQGDVIATLDNTDFKIAVSDKQASFSRAKKDYNRGKKLVKEGHISKMDFDQLESSFLSTRADLNLAKQQLAYTELKAPFNGTIAKRHVQNFEEVQAKQEIVSLNDNDILDVKFNLPENLILSINEKEGSPSIEDNKAKDLIPVFASFQSQKEREYRLTFKEISTKADSQTQTFAITYTLPKPDNLILLPGMTASVRVDLSHYMVEQSSSFYLPVSAVIADTNLQGMVWVVNEQSMRVEPVAVKVGSMNGNQIQVTEGLDAGQRVVVAGVPFLYSGLEVRLMKQTEQARDNLQHSSPKMKHENEPEQSDKKGA